MAICGRAGFNTKMAGLPGIRFVFWGEECGKKVSPYGITRSGMDRSGMDAAHFKSKENGNQEKRD